METYPVNIDPLVRPLLLEQNDEQADALFTHLLKEHVERVVKGVIRYKLHLNPSTDTRAEAEDIYQEVILQLVTQLQRFRKSPQDHPITDLRGIAAVIAHRTCARWLRRQFPQRHALKNRLHYLLTRQRGFSIWQSKNETPITGYEEWNRQKRTVVPMPPASDDRLIENVRAQLKKDPQNLAPVAAAVFDFSGGPVEFDEFVSFVAGLLGVRDHAIESFNDDDDEVAFEPLDEQPNAAWQFEKRSFLQRLWDELRQLPSNQRAALLLNLRDNQGRGCLALFPVTGVASVRQLAEALGINAETLAAMWNELPFEDARIAELLGISRQQVINARKSGRERLARRLKGFF